MARGSGWESELSESSLNNCTDYESWRIDLEGVWSEKHLRFPLFGVVLSKISIVALDALVARVMALAPYRSARRVFWVSGERFRAISS